MRGHVSPSLTVRSAIRIAGDELGSKFRYSRAYQDLARPICVCVSNGVDGQLAVLRFFIGAKRRRFLATHDARANPAQPRWTAGRMQRDDPSARQ